VRYTGFVLTDNDKLKELLKSGYKRYRNGENGPVFIAQSNADTKVARCRKRKIIMAEKWRPTTMKKVNELEESFLTTWLYRKERP